MKETKLKNVDRSIKNNCYLISAKSQKEIFKISNFIAPEHLHIHEKFNKNIYDKRIKIMLIKFIRGEKKFKLEIPKNIKSMLSKIFSKHERYIGFAPGAGQKEKIWNLKNYLMLAEYFQKKGFKNLKSCKNPLLKENYR